MDCGSTILIFIAFIQATCGQPVTLTGPPNGAIEKESDTVYTCTGGETPYIFTWTDLSVSPNVPIFTAGGVTYQPEETKYLNFGVIEDGGTSTMTISNTQIDDEGQYRCAEGSERDEQNLTVEVKGTWSLSVQSTLESNIDMYEATCEALDGRPEVTITWMLGDGPSPCGDPVETILSAGSGLFSKRSVCTFQATRENYNQILKCVITGHQVSDINGNETITLDMHSAPRNDNLMVTFEFPGTSLRVSCDIVGADQPVPLPRNYSIFSDGTEIPKSSTGINFVVVLESDFDLETEFYCQASNYLDIATSQTTKPTHGPKASNIGAIVGGVVGAIVVIIIIIAVVYCKKQERYCFEAGGTKSSGSSKPAGSAVGSSNGSERDVESPLNGVKDVTAEEKTRPEAAPRGHGSIQHTNDNPNQDMYAMVDKKKPTGGGGVGDAPDRGSGPGQNEPGSMLYADLDLSHKAGHTDKHVPKNESDVVVYSSILV